MDTDVKTPPYHDLEQLLIYLKQEVKEFDPDQLTSKKMRCAEQAAQKDQLRETFEMIKFLVEGKDKTEAAVALSEFEDYLAVLGKLFSAQEERHIEMGHSQQLTHRMFSEYTKQIRIAELKTQQFKQKLGIIDS